MMSPTIGMPFAVHYAEDLGAAPLRVDLIQEWQRGDIPTQITGSSGPKDYIKNLIFEIFTSNPKVNRVVWLRGAGLPFLLLHLESRGWFDVTGRYVLIATATERTAA